MARSKQVTFRCPHAVADAIAIHLQRGDYGPYPSDGALHTSLALYAALFPVRHDLTVAIAHMRPAEQDEIHDFAQRLAQAGISVESLTDEKPLTAKTLLALARK